MRAFRVLQKLKSTIKPNIYECRICGEHHCEHEFPDDLSILQEMTPIMTVPSSLNTADQFQQQPQQYTGVQAVRPPRPAAVQPRILLQEPPAGHPHKAAPAANGNNGQNGAPLSTATSSATTDEPSTIEEETIVSDANGDHVDGPSTKS